MTKGEIHRLDNLFSEQEIATIKQLIDDLPDYRFAVKDQYGRRTFEGVKLPDSIKDKLTKIVNETFNTNLEIVYPSIGTEYATKYNGYPNLPTHFDGDFNDVIIDYQLESNTQWPIGVNLELHPLTDNSAVMFNPNTNIHWRPRKAFKDGEYVRMVFFRFFNPVNKSDYSYLPNHPDDPVFAEVNAYRDSLGLLEA